MDIGLGFPSGFPLNLAHSSDLLLSSVIYAQCDALLVVGLSNKWK